MTHKKRLDEICPVCRGKLVGLVVRPHGRDGNAYDCPNCGRYFASGTAIAMLENITDWEKAGLSYQIWRNRGVGGTFELFSTHVDQIDLEDIPGPDEQLDNLIAFWAEQQGIYVGQHMTWSWLDLRAKLGSITGDDVSFIASNAVQRGLIAGESKGSVLRGTLSIRGWEEYRRIERGASVSHHAFMAMPFGFPQITQIVDEVFRPAVKETGFTLKRLDDEPRSGLIDDRLRVEIRQCKFLIAEMTHENRGAYWEAGFAEGLSKPVIYTCEKGYFDEKSTHFDTNHCTTVVWDEKDLPRAAEELKATIRNTFPFEAKMPPEPG